MTGSDLYALQMVETLEQEYRSPEFLHKVELKTGILNTVRRMLPFRA